MICLQYRHRSHTGTMQGCYQACTLHCTNILCFSFFLSSPYKTTLTLAKLWREEITDTRKTRACISRSHSPVSRIQITNVSTLNPQTPELQEGDILYEGDGMAPLFTVSIFTMTEPSCSRPGSALSLGAAPRARLTRTIRTHGGWWLHSCHLQRTATRIYSRMINIPAIICPAATPEC